MGLLPSAFLSRFIRRVSGTALRAWLMAGLAGCALLLCAACATNNRPPPGPTPIPTATLTPFQVTDKGAVVYQIQADSSDEIASIELHPDQKELLLNLRNGLTAHIERVQWNGPVAARTPLAEGLDQARYSPDGSQIVFSGLLLSRNNAKPEPIRQAQKGVTPSWSPDSKQIAFMRFEEGHPPGCASDSSVDEPGSCVSVVVFELASQTERVILTHPYIGGPPTWSPDQRYLLVSEGGEGGSALDALEIATGKLIRLVPNPDRRSPPESIGYTDAVWTPDSQRVIYAALIGSLYVVPVTGGAAMLLVEDGAQPYWPPGQRWLYYLTAPQVANGQLAAQQVWRIDPINPTASRQRVLDTPLYCNSVVWSRAADLLACSGAKDNLRTVTLYAISTSP